MSGVDRLVAVAVAVVIALIAAAVFLLIKGTWDNEKRNDELQQQCIRAGGNWDYGCDMKPGAK